MVRDVNGSGTDTIDASLDLSPLDSNEGADRDCKSRFLSRHINPCIRFAGSDILASRTNQVQPTRK